MKRLLPLIALAACGKVPITDINAGFALADAAWFEDEQTLFVFYEIHAEQGLNPESVVELRYLTDDLEQPWTPLSSISPVHRHVPADCGEHTLCGSMSLHVAREPRFVALRLRYHRDGAMALDAATVFNAVQSGPAHSHRSFLVYGVFDEQNRRASWRGRHQFPTLRNAQAEGYGLLRWFSIDEQRFGDVALPAGNPYGYGFAADCPPGLLPAGVSGPLESEARAQWNAEQLPLAAASYPVLCARATVSDGTGIFTTAAVAQKNPEVRPAFPELRSPIREDTPIRYLLAPCTRTIDSQHQSMQLQRLLMDGDPTICIDDWRAANFVDTLVSSWRDRIDQVRAAGRDMVLALALHHDDTSGDLAAAVEEALYQVLSVESPRSTPRVTGAFVFDSYWHPIWRAELRPLVLWCPSDLPDTEIDDASTRSCPTLPDDPTLKLGPFSFTTIPILPSRERYLRFLGTYSEGQAGRMRQLAYLAPERTPTSENVPLGEFGVATFFNNEAIGAAAADAFSYCPSALQAPIVFRTASLPEPLPIAALPEVHADTSESTYSLGLAWDFPFLLRADYEVELAGAATAFSLTVPFGIGAPTSEYWGSSMWSQSSFPLAEALAQCTRFCDHPTFDSAGVYNVVAPFRSTYAMACYRPRYPLESDGGFPLDP